MDQESLFEELAAQSDGGVDPHADAAETPAGGGVCDGLEKPEVSSEVTLANERQQCLAAEDRELRLRADFENYKRRMTLETEMVRSNIAADILERFLSVMDDLDRALATVSAEAPPVWVEGLEMVRRSFLGALSELGLVRMESAGQQFDPEKHQAMVRVEDSGLPSNTVVEELRPGYSLGNRTIRPALVKVQA